MYGQVPDRIMVTQFTRKKSLTFAKIVAKNMMIKEN